MKKIAATAVVLILTSFQIEAFPNGAPESACGTLVPRHSPNQASGPIPYRVVISSLEIMGSSGFGYEAGKTYQSKLYVYVYILSFWE